MTTPSLGPTEITAGRLHLRPWRAADADAVHAVCSDPEVQRWTTLPAVGHREHAVDYVERLSPQGWADGTAACFAVVDATTGDLLANVSLSDIADAAAVIGFWAGPEARGRGVTTEAVGAVCRWGFGALGLERVTWYAIVGNAGSRRVAERNGFVVEGTLRRWLVQRGERRDAWVAGLLPGDLPQ
ncbi:MAG TPA: GNAT family protein [Mycobacteriales bacterium]|nr:GNAT family protein [Mycobacteriales bacterium]